MKHDEDRKKMPIVQEGIGCRSPRVGLHQVEYGNAYTECVPVFERR